MSLKTDEKNQLQYFVMVVLLIFCLKAFLCSLSCLTFGFVDRQHSVIPYFQLHHSACLANREIDRQDFYKTLYLCGQYEDAVRCFCDKTLGSLIFGHDIQDHFLYRVQTDSANKVVHEGSYFAYLQAIRFQCNFFILWSSKSFSFSCLISSNLYFEACTSKETIK